MFNYANDTTDLEIIKDGISKLQDAQKVLEETIEDIDDDRVINNLVVALDYLKDGIEYIGDVQERIDKRDYEAYIADKDDTE